MRLNPRPQDGYEWKPCPGYGDSFSLLTAKNLSDHSISTYRFLSRQVGSTFEAVPAEVGAEDANPIAVVRGRLVLDDARKLTILTTARRLSEFSAEIDRLQQENAALSGRIQELSDVLESETERRLCVERDNKELRASLQAAEADINDRAEKARRCQAPLQKCFDELDRTVPILAELRRIALEAVAP